MFVDGERAGTISFHGRTRRIDFGHGRLFRGLDAGEHRIRVVMQRRVGFVEGFVVRR